MTCKLHLNSAIKQAHFTGKYYRTSIVAKSLALPTKSLRNN
jgi:hypothetical protein